MKAVMCEAWAKSHCDAERLGPLLETTSRPVDWIANDVGFGNPATLRHHFSRARAISPQQCRRTFCSMPEASTTQASMPQAEKVG